MVEIKKSPKKTQEFIYTGEHLRVPLKMPDDLFVVPILETEKKRLEGEVRELKKKMPDARLHLFKDFLLVIATLVGSTSFLCQKEAPLGITIAFIFMLVLIGVMYWLLYIECFRGVEHE